MPLDNLGIVCSGLWRCAQPRTDGFAVLSDVLNVTTVVKLNDNGEFADQQEKDSFKNGDVICEPYPRLFFVPPKQKVLATVQKIIGFLDTGKCVAVHCSHGIDRTGLIIGAFRIIRLGWTMKQVQEERYRYGASPFRDVPDHLIVELLEKIAAGHGQNAVRHG